MLSFLGERIAPDKIFKRKFKFTLSPSLTTSLLTSIRHYSVALSPYWVIPSGSVLPQRALALPISSHSHPFSNIYFLVGKLATWEEENERLLLIHIDIK